MNVFERWQPRNRASLFFAGRHSAHTREVYSQISCCWDENQIRWCNCTGWVAPSQGVYVTQVLVHEARRHNSFITCNVVEQQLPLWLKARWARRENCWFTGRTLTMSFGWHLEEADFSGFFLIPLDRPGTSTEDGTMSYPMDYISHQASPQRSRRYRMDANAFFSTWKELKSQLPPSIPTTSRFWKQKPRNCGKHLLKSCFTCRSSRIDCINWKDCFGLQDVTESNIVALEANKWVGMFVLRSLVGRYTPRIPITTEWSKMKFPPPYRNMNALCYEEKKVPRT